MMSEKKDYHKFRAHIIHPSDRIDRLENLVTFGMPDVNYCFDGVEGWIEIKSPVEPKRSTTALFSGNHKFSQNQKNWFIRQLKAGGLAFALICTDKRWILIDANTVENANEMTVSELLQKSVWCSDSKSIYWESLRKALRNEI